MSLTIKEALQRASLQLREAGLPQPRREAEALLVAATGNALAWLYAHGEELLHEEKRYFDWVQRRGRGEPYAYLAGEREFMGLPFHVTPDVLIPRPETELLAEETARAYAGQKAPRILEIGTGSGAVAVTLAVLLPHARITAVDFSAAALAVAEKNAARHGVLERIQLLQGDLYAPVAGQAFDAVVSNPPYIPSAQVRQLDITVKNFEPHLALDGGPDGCTFYRRLVNELPLLAAPPALLAFEVGMDQAKQVRSLCRGAGYKKTCQVQDLAGIPRVILATIGDGS